MIFLILNILLAAFSVYKVAEVTSTLALEESSFQIDIQPKKITAKAGESIFLNLTINAASEFKEVTKLDFTLSVMGFSYDFDLGTISPPYPQSRSYNISIPDYIPMSINAYGILKAKSGTTLRQEQIEIYIDVPLEPLKLPGRLFRTFIEVSNRLLNMTTTWVPTEQGAFSSGLLAVGTTIAVSSLALAGQESTAAFPGQHALKKIFDLLPDSTKEWLGEYVKSKSRPVQTKHFSYITRKELSAIFASVWIIAFAFSYVRATSMVEILLMIPYALGTSVLIEVVKDLTTKAVSRSHDISSKWGLCSLGLAVFAFSTILFKTPISSPKKIYCESDKYTKRSRGIVSTMVVLVPLIIFAAFYILFIKGFTFLGNMGMMMSLTSALNDSIPIQPMNGKDIYDWNKALWACLFIGSFSFYALQFLIFKS